MPEISIDTLTDKIVDGFVRNPPKYEEPARKRMQQRQLLRTTIITRLAAGDTLQDVADLTGFSYDWIRDEWVAIQEKWLKPLAEENLDIWRRRELDKLDALEAEYWDAWERSKKDKEIRGESQKEGGGKLYVNKTHRKIGQVGNPVYLAGIESCMKRRAELLGLDAIVKTEIIAAPETKALFDIEKLHAAMNNQTVRDLAAEIDEAIASPVAESES